jgi:hypothetical protein
MPVTSAAKTSFGIELRMMKLKETEDQLRYRNVKYDCEEEQRASM